MIRAGIGQTFEAFGVGLFRLHWLLTAMAFMAFSMNFTVLPIVAFEIGGDNSSVSLALAGNGIAWFFIGPFAGALTDRLSKRRLIVLAQTAIAINYAIIGFLILIGRIEVVWLTVSTLLLGACFAFTGPSRRAYVADIVPPRLVGNGVALLQSGLTFPQAVGPVLGSLLLFAPFIGADGAYFIMSGILVVTILSLPLMPPGSPRNVERGSVLRELLRSLRYAWTQPRLRVLLATLMLVSATAGPYQNILPGLLENAFGIESRNLGLTMWPMGLGSLLVGLAVAGAVGTRWSAGVLLVMSCAFGIGVALLGVTPNPLLMLPVVFLMGAGFSGFQTLNTAEVIRQSSPEYHGRITALTFLPFGVQSFTGLGFGKLADMIGEQDVLVIMGLSAIAISLVLGVIYLRMRTPAMPITAERVVRRALRPIAAVMRPQKRSRGHLM